MTYVPCTAQAPGSPLRSSRFTRFYSESNLLEAASQALLEVELLLELLVAAPVGVHWPHLEGEFRPEGELGARVLLVGPVLHSDLPNYVGVGGLSILDRDQRFFLLLEGTYEHNGLVERSCVSQEDSLFVLAILLLRHRRRGELLQNGVQ